ncbi:serine hydrolase FSH [Lasiosphaeria ovina]|uniref:Serine hydrolase FSH n=1 Tax=Lasiosphaeria ovina TaxID=92902 RepID=A0AAE0JSH0_9PEZI|nr:serine hydrolase FSH [Lasiosphaeria ovina]
MRFLCLHGLGTNSQILESQLDPIRSRLPSSYKFEFLDGDEPTTPFPDIAAAYPGPYLCYYDGPTPAAVQAAADAVLDVVSEDGPFDVVLGFSSGASLAATILAAAAERRPADPPPFKAAVFVCAIVPYRLGSGPLRIDYDPASPSAGHVVRARRCDVPETEDEGYDIWRDPEAAPIAAELDERSRLKRGSFADGLQTWSADFLLAYHPSVHGTHAIAVPTVHVVGQNDVTFGDQGRTLAELCSPRGRKVVTHAGGHHFPRDAATTDKVAAAIEAMVERVVMGLA